MAQKQVDFPHINLSFDAETLQHSLYGIPDQSTLAAAVFFETVARQLRERHKAHLIQQEKIRAANNRFAEVSRLPRDMLDMVLDGRDFDDVVETLCRLHEVPKQSLYKKWMETVKAIEDRTKAQRNELVRSMANANYSNRRICKETGLSVRQVSRILNGK